MSECHEAVQIDGQWVCQAKHCPHRLKGGGCKLGKVSLTCDFLDCKRNNDGHCLSMDVHLGSSGKCLEGLIQ